ncbi:hypothetical protein E4U40_004104 [Claviceps sp. LM458 group G5]|nr:hypothetical protein E4U40_004104 [Claviceps sp. LM458 group G5]
MALTVRHAKAHHEPAPDELRRWQPAYDALDVSQAYHLILFGIKTHWHKRVVRSGLNTLCPFEKNPNVRVIEEDDILFADLGPVFEAWEADFGRTFVPGSDVRKLKLRDALEPMWHKVKAEYIQTRTCLAKDRTGLR